MIFICHQHGKLSRQRQHRRLIGKEYGTITISSEQNDFAIGTVKVPFASYGHRGPAPARDSELSLTLTTIQTQSTCSVRTDVLPDRLVITN